MARHRFEPHTADVQIALQAESREALYAEAARALAELTGERLGELAEEAEEVSITASDPAGLLVDWLNELVFLSEVRHRVFTDVDVQRVTDTTLTARVRGRPVHALRTAVKAATWHQVAVRRTAQGWEGTVILDV